MSLFSQDKPQQSITGSNNQQALGDINNLTIAFPPNAQRESAIEKVLAGLYSLTENQDLSFTPPDTQTYTIHDKILYNKLKTYQDFYDDFSEIYPLIAHKINIASSSDPVFRLKVIRYIQGIFRNTAIALNLEDSDAPPPPDKIIQEMSLSVKRELKDCNSLLDLDELNAIDYVIFYVFAECKIFDKPPIKKP